MGWLSPCATPSGALSMTAGCPSTNNASELQLRREVIGRRNWWFVGSDEAAEVKHHVRLAASQLQPAPARAPRLPPRSPLPAPGVASSWCRLQLASSETN